MRKMSRGQDPTVILDEELGTETEDDEYLMREQKQNQKNRSRDERRPSMLQSTHIDSPKREEASDTGTPMRPGRSPLGNNISGTKENQKVEKQRTVREEVSTPVRPNRKPSMTRIEDVRLLGSSGNSGSGYDSMGEC